MTDKPEIMTWAELGDWISKLTPEQRSMRAVVFDNEAGAFTSASMTFLASKDGEAGQFVYGQPPGEVAENQPILQVW